VARYERLRESSVSGGRGGSTHRQIVLAQGLWAWMILAGAEEHGEARPALLQGLAVCGRCGGSMSPRYHRRGGKLTPMYFCPRSTEHREPACQVIPGGGIDLAMAQLLLEAVSPHALGLALAVHSELEARAMEVERLRSQQIERAEHEAEQARLRYMAVDATNRWVAGSLEAAWDEKLRALDDIRLRIERERESDRTTLDEATKRRIRALAEDIPSVWSDPSVSHRERKRSMALLVADVTLTKEHEAQQIVIGVRFRGGATTTRRTPAAKSGWQLRQTDADVLARVEALLKMHPIPEVASMLNAEGWTTGGGASFTKTAVHWLMHRWGFKSCRQHLREAGYLTAKTLAALLGRSKTWVRDARRQGGVRAYRYNRRDHLYAPITEQPPSIQARAARHAAGRANRRSDTLTAGGAVWSAVFRVRPDLHPLRRTAAPDRGRHRAGVRRARAAPSRPGDRSACARPGTRAARRRPSLHLLRSFHATCLSCTSHPRS
jgi:hypothetical protein